MNTPQQGAGPQQGTGAQQPHPQASTDGAPAASGNHTEPGNHTAPGTSAEPVVFDVGKRAVKMFLLGGGICAFIGIMAIYSGLTGHVSGTSGTPAVIIGALFLVPALLFAASWRMMTRPRKFILDGGGITWDDPKGAPWSVRWDELAHVEITYTTKQLRAQGGGVTTQRSQQYLDLYPGYRSFRQCHPQMENLWNMSDMHNGYRMMLGPVPSSVLDDGFRKFCPQIYAGVRER